MFSLCQTTILLISLTVGVTNSIHCCTKCNIRNCNGQLKQRIHNISHYIQEILHVAVGSITHMLDCNGFHVTDCHKLYISKFCHKANTSCISIEWHINPTEIEIFTLNIKFSESLNHKESICSKSHMETTIQYNESPSTFQTPDPAITSPNSGSISYQTSSGGISTPSPSNGSTSFVLASSNSSTYPTSSGGISSTPSPSNGSTSSVLASGTSSTYPTSSGDISTPSPSNGSTSSVKSNCRTKVTVLAVVLAIVIFASAVVISLLLWRMRKLAETYRCCERGCLPFCRIHNADDESHTTSARQLENPEQFYNTARRLDSNEHEYTGLQERAGTSQTLPTPLEREYSLARNIPEEVTNTDNVYSLAKVVPVESKKQGEGSVVHNLVKHPDTISGGATPTYFILEKESDNTLACKESESNQEYFILENDSGQHSDED